MADWDSSKLLRILDFAETEKQVELDFKDRVKQDYIQITSCMHSKSFVPCPEDWYTTTGVLLVKTIQN